MELCAGWPCPHRYRLSRNYSLFLFNNDTFLHQSFSRHLSLEKTFRDNLLRFGSQRLILKPRSSSRKGLRIPVLEESCNIVWTLEASLEAGEDLFITGDLSVLGNWKPDSALQLHPLDGGKLWKCEIKVPCGVNFKYNYFTINKEASHYILWKPGPKFSLSVPPKPQVNDKISVRDNWITFKKPCPAPLIWGSWAKDVDLFENSSSNSSALTDAKNSWDIHLNHPIEEPWFLYSTILPSKDDLTPAKLRFEEQKNLMLRDDGKSTTILINTSICTMQRIAVLENDKLVELLLEPVKSDVQCDSVYVGVVTQLLPHMGGALVDIGSSRPAFMDIDQNRKPFVVPSFNLEKSDTFASEGDQANANNVSEDFDDFFSSNQSEGLINDDADELDILDEKAHKNGSLFDYDKLAKNFEKETSLILKEQTGMGKHWDSIGTGAKIIVQVFKEGLGTKRPSLTPYPHLRSRFWILLTRCNRIGVSRKIIGSERLRLKVIAKILQPPGFGLTVRTVAAGHPWKELHKDLKGLLATWKNITESAKSAVLAAEDGVEGAVPVILHRAMGQTLSVVQDYFNEKVKKMVVDSQRTYHEVTSYLQDVAPDLCNRVELYTKKNTLFGEFKIEEEINNILSKRVPLTNGGSLVIEQTEALVSIDVNGGHVMFGQGTSPAKAVLDVNLAAAKQIARELRLRDIGGIIVVDFIDMEDDGNKRLVYEEMKRAVENDRSTVKVSELSKHGLMEITRKRVRPSVTFMVSEPCTCCHATGRVEALETVFSKIEQEICRSLAGREREADAQSPKSWPKFLLRVDHQMCNYLTAGKKTKLGILSSSLKVWIVLKVAREFGRGSFEVKAFGEDKKTALQISHAPIAIIRQPPENKQVTVLTIKKAKGRKMRSLSSDSDF